MKSLTSIMLASSLLLASCSQKKEDDHQAQQNNNPSYRAPVQLVEDMEQFTEPRGEMVANHWMDLDLNCDQISDQAIILGNKLYFKKGLGNNTYQKEFPILEIRGNFEYYRFEARNNHKRPGIVLGSSSGCRYQPNLGNNDDGIPFFGTAEDIKSN